MIEPSSEGFLPEIYPPELAELSTVKDHLRWAVSRMNQADVFFGHGTDNATDDAIQLMAMTLHLPWFEVEQWLDSKLTLAEKQAFYGCLLLRIN